MIFSSIGNNTFLDLREEDNLSIVDEMAGPFNSRLVIGSSIVRGSMDTGGACVQKKK